MLEILDNQHAEANQQFVRFVEDHYEAWMTGMEQGPTLSHEVLPKWLPGALEGAQGRPVFLVVIDNLRWDQWRTIAPTLRPKWNVVEETTYFSMLPTATQYARNALFAGMTPGGVLTSIDTEAEYQRHAREALVSLGHESSRARLIAGRALDVLPRMSDGAYDVVVVDADRGEYPAMLEQAKRLLRIGGVVAFLGIGEDDMVADPARRDVEAMAVKELAQVMRRDADWAATPLAEGNGMLVACLRRRD